MQERFTKGAKAALSYAKQIAKELEHSYVGTEHILVGLTKANEGVASIVLNSFGVTDEKIIELIEQYIDPVRPVGLADPEGYTPKAEKLISLSEKEAEKYLNDYFDKFPERAKDEEYVILKCYKFLS